MAFKAISIFGYGMWLWIFVWEGEEHTYVHLFHVFAVKDSFTAESFVFPNA